VALSVSFCLCFLSIVYQCFGLKSVSYDLTNLFDLVALKIASTFFFLLPVIVHFSFSFFTNTVVKSGTMFSPSFYVTWAWQSNKFSHDLLSLFLDQGSKTVVHL